MKRLVNLLATAACANALAALPALAQTAPEVTLTRLECGTPAVLPLSPRFSDTYAYGDRKNQFVFSCYLIKHGDDYCCGTPATR